MYFLFTLGNPISRLYHRELYNVIFSYIQGQSKTPKGQSKTVNRRTDNAVADIKRTRKQTTIYKTLHIKLKIERHEPDQNRG